MSAQKKCGLKQTSIFLLALVSGTCSSISAKTMLDMKSYGMTGELESFSYPLFQVFGMFIGMLFSLLMHFLVTSFNLKFPGYELDENKKVKTVELPTWMYFYLIVPSMFDLLSTGFSMYGLMYINVSVFQMLRGGAIVFVAILKEFYLGHKLSKYMWVGIFWNVVSIILVGTTAFLSPETTTDDGGGTTTSNPLLGVFLVLTGAFIGAMQYAFEEQVMNMDIAAPPLLLVGMEGLWGTLCCVFILYPIAYIVPGSDHGSFENPFNTYALIANSQALQLCFVAYFFAIFFYNIFGILITFTMNSVWRAILDNFRPISVWGCDLFIFYAISTSFGEPWTQWSFLQLAGLMILLYGTAIYNAPNPGSLKLTGNECLGCGLDFSSEYAKIEDQGAHDESEAVAPSPYLSNLSPFLTPSRRNTPGVTPGSAVARTRLLAITTTPKASDTFGSFKNTQFEQLKKQKSFA